MVFVARFCSILGGRPAPPIEDRRERRADRSFDDTATRVAAQEIVVPIVAARVVSVPPEIEVEAASKEEDFWRSANELSVASTTANSVDSTGHGLLNSIDFCLDVEADTESEGCFEPVRVDICEELFFVLPDASSSSDSGIPPLARAEAIEVSALNILRVVGRSTDGACRSEAFSEASCETAGVPCASPEELVVDCCNAGEDEPKLVKLVGARLCQGRLGRVVVQQGADGASPSVWCELLRGPESKPEVVEQVPLARGVALLREAQWRRHVKALQEYQRALNCRLMGARRRQAMGFC